MLLIREMQPTDWQYVKAIFEESLSRGDITFHSYCPAYNEWDKSHLKECRYVCIVDNKIAGFAVLSPTSNRECYKGVVEVSIYVAQEFHKMGVGTALLNKLIENSEKAGFWCLYSLIFENNIASINLHKKCGFRTIGYRERIAKDVFGNWRNAVIMEYRNSIV